MTAPGAQILEPVHVFAARQAALALASAAEIQAAEIQKALNQRMMNLAKTEPDTCQRLIKALDNTRAAGGKGQGEEEEAQRKGKEWIDYVPHPLPKHSVLSISIFGLLDGATTEDVRTAFEGGVNNSVDIVTQNKAGHFFVTYNYREQQEMALRYSQQICGSIGAPGVTVKPSTF